MAKRKRKQHANAYRRARTPIRPLPPLVVPRRKRITMQTPQLQRVVGPTPVRWTGPNLIDAQPLARTAWNSVKLDTPSLHAKPPLKFKGLYKLPHKTGVCVRRKTRKQVILAMTKGKGLGTRHQKKRRLTNDSEFSC